MRLLIFPHGHPRHWFDDSEALRQKPSKEAGLPHRKQEPDWLRTSGGEARQQSFAYRHWIQPHRDSQPKSEARAPGDPRLMTARDLDELRSFKVPKDPQYALVSGLDSIVLLRRDLLSLVDLEDRKRSVFVDRDSKELGGLKDLPSQAIMDRGRVVGIWEFGTAANEIVWVCFVKKNKTLQHAVDRMDEFVRSQLGDVRSFSLDSPKSRVPRIEALRKAARLS